VRVVGVLGGVWKFSILERNKMALYTPMAQSGGARPGSIFIRPRGDARDLLAETRTVVQAANPRLPAVRVSLVRDIIAPEIRPWRFGAEIFSGFSALALLIAAVGLYAVVSLGVALRAKEIGIRLALGAPRRHIVAVAAREALTDVAIGLAIGAFLVFAASRWLSGVLFETSPADASALVSTLGILFAFSVAAIAWPVARALRTDIAGILQSS
jgi:putative ABC transport system permease protein